MKVLKFGAEWCSGCLVMRPRWAEIEKELPWLKTEMYDYDKNKEMVEKHKINQNLPTFIFLDKNGNEITRLGGEPSKKELLALIEEHKDK
ncbi:MAG: thioredoxin family protein [Patescibacteria group bacterium]|jgi:thiol-disulfide isomerase/thioredoxin|nr:thioredoxin family protein [Patescibacteria group bacterium]MDD5173123.1 thioredoxin family protein [Patescibacteria group bacterium]